MRTRFLNRDYFCHSQIETLETSTFFSIPLPQLPKSHLLHHEIDFSSFDLFVDVSSEIDCFPIDNAVSHFFSAVIPQIYDGEVEEELHNSIIEASEIRIHENKNGLSSEESDDEKYKGIRFETPELDFPLLLHREHASSCKEDERGISFGSLKIVIPLDMLDVKLDNTISYPVEVSRSIYSVDDMPAKYHIEDESSVPGKTLRYPDKVPHFEVSEIGLELYASPSIEEIFQFLISNVEYPHQTHNNDFVVDCTEIMGSMGFDILECLSGHCQSEKGIDLQPICLNWVLEMDFIRLKDTTQFKTGFLIYPGASNGHSFSMVPPTVHFQEVEILDLGCPQPFQAFLSSQTDEPDTSELMFGEDVNSVGNFYECIVSPELALVDDMFKSFPVPVFFDDKEIVSLSAVVEDILWELKPHPPSACDGIYLDWHLLQAEDECNRDICSTYRYILDEVDSYETAYEVKSSNEEMILFDFVLCDDASNEVNILPCKDAVREPLTKVGTNSFLKDEKQNLENGEVIPAIDPQKLSSLLESMSQFNDLNFFLNARKGSTGRTTEDVIKEKTCREVSPVVVSEVKFQWDIEVHWVKLSVHILGLIDKIKKNYLAILETVTDWKKKHCSFLVEDEIKLLSLPKKTLMDLINKTAVRETILSHKNETLKAFIALFAIRKMASHLCFFGIHTAHLYVSNLCQNLDCLTRKLRSLQCLLQDAQNKIQKESIESHPALSAIEMILRSKKFEDGKKVLIVAERVLWWSLNMKLNAMKMSCHEVKNVSGCFDQQNALDRDGCTNSILLHSDCVLISHEHLSASFPFDKFNIILEYGGSDGSSRIPPIPTKFVGLPRIHFLKVDLQDCSVPKAFCQGFDVLQLHELTMEGSQTIPGVDNQKVVALLNFAPIMEKDSYLEFFEAADKVETCDLPELVSSMPSSSKPEAIHSSMLSSPDSIIIVNTHNFGKEMLISRRSSYQKILEMEKRGVQVVEREFHLPADLIFSAAICLVWCDAKNIRTSAVVPDEASSSCIPFCIENIATNTLMSLSFAFSICILVFEGESTFLASIMESSDGLYAAAASLDIQLQLFCSSSPELTDEIILSCIKYAHNMNQGLFPPMLESETLAESFLTKFPSINPLSAHAILSSGGTLVEFLEMSHEHRIRATRKYHVPDESVTLFNALCRYGDLGESKSGMTECSSTVSSALESDIGSHQIQSQKKKQKYYNNSHTYDLTVDNTLYFEPMERSAGGISKPSKASSRPPCPELLEHPGTRNFPLLGEEGNVKSYISSLLEDMGSGHIDESGKVNEDYSGEVIDFSNPFLENDFSFENTTSFSKRAPEMGKGAAEDNSIHRNLLPFGKSNHPNYPTSSEINDLDIWISLEDKNPTLEENAESNMGALPMKRLRGFSEERKMQSISRDGLLGENPLSDSNCSSQLQRGSPWTIEFLNKVKEKTRMRQQSLQCNMSTDCCRGSGDISKCSKRQSPSILDTYRYQGGNQTKKTIREKLRKKFKQPLGVFNTEKKVPPFVSTLTTPIDKRARQVGLHGSPFLSSEL